MQFLYGTKPYFCNICLWNAVEVESTRKWSYSIKLQVPLNSTYRVRDSMYLVTVQYIISKASVRRPGQTLSPSLVQSNCWPRQTRSLMSLFLEHQSHAEVTSCVRCIVQLHPIVQPNNAPQQWPQSYRFRSKERKLGQTETSVCTRIKDPDWHHLTHPHVSLCLFQMGGPVLPPQRLHPGVHHRTGARCQTEHWVQ